MSGSTLFNSSGPVLLKLLFLSTLLVLAVTCDEDIADDQLEDVRIFVFRSAIKLPATVAITRLGKRHTGFLMIVPKKIEDIECSIVRTASSPKVIKDPTR